MIAQSSLVRVCRAVNCHFRRLPVFALWLLTGMAALVFIASCNHDIPVIAVGPKPVTARATIYGVVRGPQDSPAGERMVNVVNVATGQRREVQTSSSGAFTIEVPAGSYRLELALRDGERLVKGPGEMHLDSGEIKSHVEFVVDEALLAHPHGPAYRVENGLRSPIA